MVEKLKVNKDTEKCGTEAVIEKVVVGGNKGLANAVVSVPGAKGATQAKAVLDQHGCKFVPHVVVMQPGEIEIKNSDDILHNIHTYSTANPSINKAQPKFKKTMTEKFEKPEFVKLTCDVHSWMLGWVAVMPGPVLRRHRRRRRGQDRERAGRQAQGRGVARDARQAGRRKSRSRPGRRPRSASR